MCPRVTQIPNPKVLPPDLHQELRLFMPAQPIQQTLTLKSLLPKTLHPAVLSSLSNLSILPISHNLNSTTTAIPQYQLFVDLEQYHHICSEASAKDFPVSKMASASLATGLAKSFKGDQANHHIKATTLATKSSLAFDHTSLHASQSIQTPKSLDCLTRVVTSRMPTRICAPNTTLAYYAHSSTRTCEVIPLLSEFEQANYHINATA